MGAHHNTYQDLIMAISNLSVVRGNKKEIRYIFKNKNLPTPNSIQFIIGEEYENNIL